MKLKLVEVNNAAGRYSQLNFPHKNWYSFVLARLIRAPYRAATIQRLFLHSKSHQKLQLKS